MRLITAYATYSRWGDGVRRVEIVARDEVVSIPNFGLEPDDVPTKPSGWLGVISKDAFMIGGFTGPIVAVTEKGYSIRRWLFVSSFDRSPDCVQEVIEEVGKDGGYRRGVLQTRQPPNLPGVDWSIIGGDV